MEKLRTLQRNMTLNPWDGRLTRELQFVKLLRERFPSVEVRDCSPLIWELRTIKSPAEIALMRRAGRIGVAAHTEMIKATRPGQFEYELSAAAQLRLREGRGAGERVRRHHLVRREPSVRPLQPPRPSAEGRRFHRRRRRA